MNLKGENMRKYSRIFIAIVLAFCLTSCGFSNFIKQLPDTITIHGREYKRAFIDELYPVDDVVDFDEGVEVGSNPTGSTEEPNAKYVFSHWTADKDVTLKDGKTIIAVLKAVRVLEQRGYLE